MATTEELLEAMRRDTHGGIKGQCTFNAWFKQADPMMRDAVTLASSDPQISIAAITRLASASGYKGGASTVKEHLGNRCTCAKHAPATP